MRIWVVNHYADPPDGLATRSYDLARRWVEKGNPTTIFVMSLRLLKIIELPPRDTEFARGNE